VRKRSLIHARRSLLKAFRTKLKRGESEERLAWKVRIRARKRLVPGSEIRINDAVGIGPFLVRKPLGTFCLTLDYKGLGGSPVISRLGRRLGRDEEVERSVGSV